jgi:hypothetical protein
MLKTKLSRDCAMLCGVEIRNEDNDGTSPATLGSTYDSFMQTPPNVLHDWLGYKKNYPYSPRLMNELGMELRRLIRKHGKKTKLISFQYLSDNE